MQRIKFDLELKKTGYNKYGHYQFGKYSCQFCKSDRLEKIKFIGENKVDNGYSCIDCNAKMIIK